jgi:predicted DNA repair protein MutK
MATRAGAKTAGVVIDDAAVTPRYVVGFASDRELPIIWRIAKGSARNKLVILLPAALLLSAFAPFLITPLLMVGGAFLAYEGAEKVLALVRPHAAHAHEEEVHAGATSPQALEDAKVAGAIRTDFILSAEIMAIALSTLPAGTGIAMQALILAIVAVAITAGVYGAVALIVRADDAGVALAKGGRSAAVRALGRGLVKGMPGFLKALSLVGTIAMLWVGGGIVLHGFEVLGFGGPAHALHDVAEAVGAAVPAAHGLVAWVVSALGNGLFALALGFLIIPLTERVFAPLWHRLRPARP